MRFGSVGDAEAFLDTRDALSLRFEVWACTHRRRIDDADIAEVEALMDRRVRHGDGDLASWDDAALRDLVPEGRPVAMFVDFLGHEGLLAAGTSAAHVREMCAELGFPSPEPHDDLLTEITEPARRPVGSLRLPTAEDHREAVRDHPGLRAIRALAAACAGPGLPLVESGAMHPIGAELLAARLAGDPGSDTVSPPLLAELVAVALATGAVRRRKGRLVEVARFRRLDDVAAHDALVRAVLRAPRTPDAAAAPDLVSPGVRRALVALLRRRDTARPGSPVDTLVEAVLGVLPTTLRWALADQATARVDALVRLGVLAAQPDTGEVALAATTARPLAALVAQEQRSWTVEPAERTAAAVLLPALRAPREQGIADITTWAAARAASDAATELVDALLEAVRADRLHVADLGTGLDVVAEALGEPVERAAGRRLRGRHGPALAVWLVDRGGATLDVAGPDRYVTGVIAHAGAVLDRKGPDEARAAVTSLPGGTVHDLLGRAWRLDHPRVADVLGAMTDHPDAAVARAARKASLQHASRRIGS